MSPRRAAVSAAVGLAVSAVLVAGCGPEAAVTPGDGTDRAPSTSGAGPATSPTGVPLPRPTSSEAGAYRDGSAFSVLLADGRFTTVVGIFERHGIGRGRELLADPDNTATLLVPTDDAWQRIHPELLAAILADDTVLTRVMRNHILPDPLTSDELAEMEETWTLGAPAGIDRSGGALTIAGATLVEVDIVAGRSVIHVLDRVALPCGDAYLADTLGAAYADVCTD